MGTIVLINEVGGGQEMQKESDIAKYKINIIRKDTTNSVLVKQEENLMEALATHGISIPAICAGRGSCGKCKVKVIEGEMPITAEDLKVLKVQDVDQGYRLSCKAKVNADLTIVIEGEEDRMIGVTDRAGVTFTGEKKGVSSYYIGIDIGTTTIAMELIDQGNQRRVASHARVNRQRRYGADIISRIQRANEGKGTELKESIREDLWEGIITLLKEAELTYSQVSGIVIAGNTTMIHLLMGYPCNTLGTYPFTPYNAEEVNTTVLALLGQGGETPVSILPGISAFVGGDIVAGLYVCDFYSKKQPCLLIDLGTNGEMALGQKDRIITTSTAAGPAFEGGNISWGVGSVPGAITNVMMDDQGVKVNTIGDEPPVGICGTGVVEITAELLKSNLLSDTGLLAAPYDQDGYSLATTEEGLDVVFTQKDVREIQLAKAAIRAGLETLIARYETDYEGIEKVYIAGGFGYGMDIEKAVIIGLLPRVLASKIEIIGNSSLGGAIKYMVETKGREAMGHIISSARELNLANDDLFNELYIEHMFFEEM